MRLIALVTLAVIAPHPHHHHRHTPAQLCRSVKCKRMEWRKHHHRRSLPAGGYTTIASYYGPGLYGNPLACGGTLEPGTLGVANKTLPCGAWLTVCARRCLRVTVIDRGPYVAGREFDLTEATRNAIGAADVGPIRVVMG